MQRMWMKFRNFIICYGLFYLRFAVVVGIGKVGIVLSTIGLPISAYDI